VAPAAQIQFLPLFERRQAEGRHIGRKKRTGCGSKVAMIEGRPSACAQSIASPATA
jgi:hypothetical protein